MPRQYQLPGGPYLNEQAERQFQIPGGSFVNVTSEETAPTLTAETIAFTLTVKNVADLVPGVVLTTERGLHFDLFIKDVSFAYSPAVVVGNRQFQIPGGVYLNQSGTRQFQIPGGVFVNESTGVTTDRTIAAERIAFSLSVKNVGLLRSGALAVQAESVPYVVTMRSVDFLQGDILHAERVEFVLSLAPSLSDHQITSNRLQFSMSTKDVGLEADTGSINMSAESIAYTFTVKGVSFFAEGDILAAADTISYVVSYPSLVLRRGFAMQALPVGFALTMGAINAENVVTVRLVDVAGVPRANLSGLRWAWFDTPSPGDMDAPTDQGVVGTTDADGVMIVALPNSTLAVGEIGYLVVTDSDGTTTQSPSHKAFSAPLAVS